VTILENQKKINLFPLWSAVFVDILGFSILLPILPIILIEDGVAPLTIGLILAINAVFTVIFAPILGKLSDKFGRRPLLLISQAGTFVGFLVLAFSQANLYIIIISRVIDGCFGGNFPIAKAVISDAIPPKERAVQMTNIGLCHVLASMAGPGIGGILSIWGLFAPGMFAASLSLVTMIMTIFLIPETWTKEKRMKFAAEKEKDKKEKKPEISFRENKPAMFLLTQWGFHTVYFFLYITTISLFGAIVLGLNAMGMGILLMISGAIRVLIRFTIFVPMLKKFGEVNCLKIGLGCFVVIFLLLAFVQEYILFVTVLILISFAASMTRGPVNSLLTQSVTKKEQGKINGYSSSLDSFGQIVGPILGGFLIGFFPAFWFAIFICSLSVIPFIMGFKNVYYNQIKEKSEGNKPP